VDRGPDYLHATNASEAETLRTNSGVYGEPRFPLAFIFPAEGTFCAEQPFCVLDADWVSDEQAEAARIYGDYLMEPEQQALTVENYLRPVDASIPLAEPFTVENGTDPRVTREMVPALASLSPEVSGAVQDVFRRTKKKATVVIVLDTSSSMKGRPIVNAVDATADFIDQLQRGDSVYVYSFNDKVNELSPSGLAVDVKETLGQTVLGLIASGNTALYDAVCTAVERVEELRVEDEAARDERLYGLVVLSDGEDTKSQITENDMVRCLPTGEDVDSPKIFTIAYGEDADEDLLLRIANRTGAKTFSGDPETIASVYKAISAEQ
jgi:Ca-activated chloride channel family protein